MVAALLTLGMIGGFLAALAAPATTAGAATTQPFSLSSASLPSGQSNITWQGPPVNPPGSPNAFPDPVQLHGQIDPSTGDITAGSLSLPAIPETGQGQQSYFAFTDSGNATGNFNSSTGAVTLNDALKLTFSVPNSPVGLIQCVSTPINVALSGTWDSSTQNVTLATTSSFTIPQFPANSGPQCSLASASLNASPGGVAGSVGNAMSLTLHGKFSAGLPSTTTLSVSPASPQPVGTSVTMTAKVSDPSGQGTPTGTVNFEDNGIQIGSGTLSSGTATFTTSSFFAMPNQPLTAVYVGDTNYSPSTSSTVPYSIQALPTISSTLPSQVPAGLTNFSTTPFDLTISNPPGGITFSSNLFMQLGISIPGLGGSQVKLSYQDQGGNWCPFTLRSFKVYFGGVGTGTCSFSPAFSLAPGSSVTYHLELALTQAPYASQPVTGPLAFTTTLETGTCTSSSSCSAVPPLKGSSAVTSLAASTVLPSGGEGSVPAEVSFPGNWPTTSHPTMRTGAAMWLSTRVQPTAEASKEYYLPPTPSGTIRYYIDGKFVKQVTLATTGFSNKSLYYPGNLTLGTHTETAEYSGSQVYAAASAELTFTVVAAQPAGATPFACSFTDPFGQAVGTFNGYVTANGPGVPVAATSGTTVKVPSASLTLGVDGAIAQTFSDLNLAQANQSATFSPGVVKVPAGSATFAATGPTQDQVGTFSGMPVSVTVEGKPGDAVPVGASSISFTFGPAGSIDCSAVSGPAPIGVVDIIGTTLSVSPSGAAPVGSVVTMTATVSPMPPTIQTSTTPAPPGQVDFYDGSTYLGTATVSEGGANLPPAGDAVLPVSTLGLGNHQLSAHWSGYSGVPPSTSNTVDYFVGEPSTTTLASGTPSPSNAADPVTFTATVTPGKGQTTAPTGSVNFTEDGTPVKACTGVALDTANPPTASCQLSFGAGETHKIVASYNGDTTYVGSTSDAVTQTTMPGVHVMLASSKNPSVAGPVAEQVALWAVVAPDSGTTTPTGTLNFLVRGNARCANVPLIADGSMAWAVCVTKFTSPDISAAATAQYSGDSTYSGATSQTLHQHTLPATTNKLSAVARSGGRVSLTAQVAPGSGNGPTPGGVVAFVVDKQVYMPCLFVPLGGAGRAECNLTLPAGTHYAHAVYLGNGGYSSSESNTVAVKATASAKHHR